MEQVLRQIDWLTTQAQLGDQLLLVDDVLLAPGDVVLGKFQIGRGVDREGPPYGRR